MHLIGDFSTIHNESRLQSHTQSVWMAYVLEIITITEINTNHPLHIFNCNSAIVEPATDNHSHNKWDSKASGDE